MSASDGSRSRRVSSGRQASCRRSASFANETPPDAPPRGGLTSPHPPRPPPRLATSFGVCERFTTAPGLTSIAKPRWTRIPKPPSPPISGICPASQRGTGRIPRCPRASCDWRRRRSSRRSFRRAISRRWESARRALFSRTASWFTSISTTGNPATRRARRRFCGRWRAGLATAKRCRTLSNSESAGTPSSPSIHTKRARDTTAGG